METYDLVVLGCGPAGEKGAVQAAYFGKRVLVIEREAVFGGAVANTGTLPSKTLRETALYLSGFRQRGLFGVEMQLDRQVNVQELMHRERAVRKSERDRITQSLWHYNVDVLYGQASFLDAHTLRVTSPEGEVRVSGSVFLIATGSHPNHPPLYPFDAENVYDSDKILELTSIPASLVVVGAGVIGCEYACTFAALGIPVTLVDGHLPLLPFLDEEMSALLAQEMTNLGVRPLMPEVVKSAEVTPERVALTFASGRTCQAAAMLVAAGRVANTEGLGLEALGILLNAKQQIPVNEHYQTAQPHIYAAGDVIGFPALASTSMEQARVAVAHAFALYDKKTALARVVPYALWTIPEVAMAGETEQSLKSQGVDYVVGRARYADNARGQIIGDGGGMLKLLFRREDLKLMGVHLLGELASELVHIGVMALLNGATADLFINTCFNYPTLSDAFKYATYSAMGTVLPRIRPEAALEAQVREAPKAQTEPAKG